MSLRLQCSSVSIFQEFEPESDDEEDDDQESDEEDGPLSRIERERLENLAIQDFPDDEPYEAPPPRTGSPQQDGGGLDTGVQTSQLRHFVIQVRLALLPSASHGLTRCHFVRRCRTMCQDRSLSIPSNQVANPRTAFPVTRYVFNVLIAWRRLTEILRATVSSPRLRSHEWNLQALSRPHHAGFIL